MSAQGRGANRTANDWYPTHPYCVLRLVESWGPLEPETIQRLDFLEPCSGDGAIVDAFRLIYPESSWTEYDIAPQNARIERANYLAPKLRCQLETFRSRILPTTSRTIS